MSVLYFMLLYALWGVSTVMATYVADESEVPSNTVRDPLRDGHDPRFLVDREGFPPEVPLQNMGYADQASAVDVEHEDALPESARKEAEKKPGTPQNLVETIHSHSMERAAFGSASLLLEDEDDRTLLDIFGESAKEYLTTSLIPVTDVACDWDWRSLRCEPACECYLNYRWGDYHIGRSCRLRPHAPADCVAIDPARYLIEKPVTKRVLSLVTQTVRILRQKVDAMAQQVMGTTKSHWQHLRDDVCHDLWELQKRFDTCIDRRRLPIKTFPERLLCRDVVFDVCDEETDFMFAQRLAQRTTSKSYYNDTITAIS